MRATTLSRYFLLFFCTFLAGGQPPQEHPVPPGLRKAEKLPNPADVPPLVNDRAQRRLVDPAQLKREADELANLAQSIPLGIEEVTRGRLSKDLDAQLKKIERLARRLRREISP